MHPFLWMQTKFPLLFKSPILLVNIRNVVSVLYLIYDKKGAAKYNFFSGYELNSSFV